MLVFYLAQAIYTIISLLFFTNIYKQFKVCETFFELCIVLHDLPRFVTFNLNFKGHRNTRAVNYKEYFFGK